MTDAIARLATDEQERRQVADVVVDLALLAQQQRQFVLGLWTLTVLLGLGMVVWVLLGDAAARLSALDAAWPLAAVWMAGLVLYSRTASHELREVMRTRSLVTMADGAAAARSFGTH